MRQFKYHSGETSQFNEKYRPAKPSSQGKEGDGLDGNFFIAGIFLGLILAWIIL